MKKGLIFATTLAMALGVGVAVGAHQGKAAKAEAATVSSVYCKMDKDWWKADGAAVGAYFWKGKDAEKVEPYAWPGTRMEAVAGQEDLWTVSVPANVEKVIFTRINGGTGAVSDWGAKTSDLDIPSKKNCYTITSESAVWGDPGVTGEWSVYPAVDPEYHLLGTFNSWNDPDGDYILTVDGEDANHYTFSDLDLTTSDQLKVCDVKNDDWFDNGEGNVTVAEDGTYDVDFYVNADNDVHIVLTKQVAEPVYTIQAGPFISGTFELDEEDKPEGVLHQYSVELDNISRALEAVFEKDGEAITTNIGADEVDNNNIYGNSTDGFRFYSSNFYGKTKVYLKTYSDGGYSVWADHRSQNSFQATVKYKSSTALAFNLSLDETYEPNETYIEQYKTSSKVVMEAMAGIDWDTSFSMDCGGITESITPEAVEGNNAMQAFQSSAWKVHNDCEEVIYLKIKRTDLSAWLYVGGYEEAVVVTIGGQEVALHKDGDEYVAHDVDLSAGDAVTAFTIEGEASEVTSKKVANNNLSESKVVIADVEDADIYYNIADKNLWISGLPAAGQHLLLNNKSAIEMIHTDPYEEYDQYASGKIEFKANDTIKVLNTGADDSYAVTWCPKIVATSKELAGKFIYDEANEQMKCTADCSAAVYLKIKSGVDEVYFGDVPEYVEEAVEYVEGFKTAMATACSAEGKKAAVEAAWAAQALAYGELSEQAQKEVKLGGYSLVEEIIEFGGRYISIKQQHSDWTLENFLEWDIPASSRYGGMDFASEANNSTMIIIISIAAASVLAFTTLLVFKKRKQK